MKLAECTPLPGNGFVARAGNLVVLCASADGDEDLLLSAMDKVTASGGDGSDLVRQVTRAALEQESPPDWACAAVTAAGGLAVLVHGAAMARVTAVDGEPVSLTGADALIPVSRVFTGPSVSVLLALPDHGDADSRLRLDGGVVQAGGVMLTTVGGQVGPEVGLAVKPPVREPERDTAPMPGQQERDTAPMPDDLAPDIAPGPAGPAILAGPATPAEPRLPEPPPVPSPEPVLHVPDASADFEAVLLILSDDDQDQAAPVQARPESEPADAQALVDGVYCPQPKNKHFNDPAVAYCRVCGLGMLQQTRNIQRGPRPPLGVLLLDDGMTFRLDADYVVGRDPGMDADVAAGRARPLRMLDPAGTISRLHLRVALNGWRVQVADLGSANGSVVRHPGVPEPQRLTPHEAVEIKPGSTIDMGRRSMRFESYLST
jgi:hypothetical protein